MKPIEPNRCGYSGYTCIPYDNFPRLDVKFMLGNWLCRSDVDERGSIIRIDDTAYCTLDNWYNLPRRFPSFSISLATLLDMSLSGDALRLIPEISCVLPGEDTPVPLGDLFAKYNTKAASSITDGNDPAGPFEQMKTRLACFEEHPAIYPPPVEPPLPVVQAPVPPLVNIQPPELPIKNIWKVIDIIEDFIDIYDPPDLACPIENLLIAMNMESQCTTIKIQLHSGVPLARGDGDAEPVLGECTYRVVNGTNPNLTTAMIKVNGTDIEVPLEVDGSYDPIAAPFDLYLNIPTADPNSAYLSTAPDAYDDNEAMTSLYIGGVHEVDGTNEGDSPNSAKCDEDEGYGFKPEYYRMYVIDQVDCPVSVSISSIDLCSIEDLLIAMNMESPCSTIKIKLDSGEPMVKGKCADDIELGDCYYRVVNGENESSTKATIMVDGKEYDVDLFVHSGGSWVNRIAAPFELYLIIPSSGDDPYLTTDSDDMNKTDTLIVIGGVREVDGSQDAVGEHGMCQPDEGGDQDAESNRDCYKMYVIYEDECPVAEYTSPSICGIETLIAELADVNNCDSVAIDHVTGSSIVSWTSDEDEPELPYNEYFVKPGTITINDNSIEIPEGLTITEFPSTVYLGIHRNEDTIEAWYTTDIEDAGVVMELAAIREIRTDESNNHASEECANDDDDQVRTNYKMLQVDVVNCPDYMNYNPSALELLISDLVDDNICDDSTQVKIQRVTGEGDLTDAPAVFYYEPPDPPPEKEIEYIINDFELVVGEKAYPIKGLTFTVTDGRVYWYAEIKDPGEVDEDDWPAYGDDKIAIVLTTDPDHREKAVPLGGVWAFHTVNYKAYVIQQESCDLASDLADLIETGHNTAYIGRAMSLEGAVNAIVQESNCSNFGVFKKSGKSVSKNRLQLGKATYGVQGGTLKINGMDVSVAGLSSVTVNHRNTRSNPVNIWLNLSISKTSASASLGTKKSGSASVLLASIAAVSSEDLKDPPVWLKPATKKGYSMYVVEQVNCAEDFDVIRLPEGFMFSIGTGTSGHPYEVYDYCEF